MVVQQHLANSRKAKIRFRNAEVRTLAANKIYINFAKPICANIVGMESENGNLPSFNCLRELCGVKLALD